MSLSNDENASILLGLFGGAEEDSLARDCFETTVALTASRFGVVPVLLKAGNVATTLANLEGLLEQAAGLVIGSGIVQGEPDARLVEVLDRLPAYSLAGCPVLLAGSGQYPTDLFALDVMLRGRLERLGARVLPRSAFALSEPVPPASRAPEQLSSRQAQVLAKITAQFQRYFAPRAYPEAYILSW